MSEREIFAQALEISAGADRAAFLEQACGGDTALRERIERLLGERENLGSYLEAPAAAVVTREHASNAYAGLHIGRYRLLEQIGEGGMGTVWVAEQTEPVKRRVALKLIKPGMDSRQVLSRFEAERQALALMDHPNIAKVHDGGMTDEGRPFFVMEYVKGVPITEYCDSARLSIQDRLKLFVQVCQAVQHAHQKGIIHRDLKPSNILVCLYDGVAIPKVIDFGLAKAINQPLTEHTLYTARGLMVGTPLYMSPEQAEFNNVDIDTRSDIYSLGVILYELLTGTTPLEKEQFKAAAVQEILRLIKEVEPPKPSTKLSGSASLPSIAAQRSLEPAQLSRTIRGDLDWIVMKSLEKERSRRYEAANGLVRDIERFMHDEPVEAGPPSAMYRLRKLARKYRMPVAIITTIAAFLILGMTISAWQAIRATRAEAIARANEHKARLAEQAERTAKGQAVMAAAAETKAKDAALQREAETAAVLNFLEAKILSADRPEGRDGGLGRDITLHDAIKAALPFVHENFKNQPVIEARLQLTVGWSFLCLGDPVVAERQFQSARTILTKHRGLNQPMTLRSMHNLATSYRYLFRFVDAAKLYEETLELRKATLGPDNPNTLSTMEGLARSYLSLGRYEQARKLFEELVSLCKNKLGPLDRHTLRSMTFLVQSNLALESHTEALNLCEEVFALCKRQLGPDDPDTIGSMDVLADCYAALGRAGEALKLRQEVLAAAKIKYGPTHPITLWMMRDVAASLMTLGQGAEAVPIIDECVRLSAGQATDPRLIPNMIDFRLRYFKKINDASGCRETAEMWEMLNRTDATSLYKAAEIRAITTVVIGIADSSEAGAKSAAAEADRAMEWLQKAVAAGYKNADQLAKDKDLDALRGRQDFQQLLAQLSASKADNPK